MHWERQHFDAILGYLGGNLIFLQLTRGMIKKCKERVWKIFIPFFPHPLPLAHPSGIFFSLIKIIIKKNPHTLYSTWTDPKCDVRKYLMQY